jgi:hypothetical protein
LDHGRFSQTIGGRVEESAIGRVIQIGGRNVVSHSENASVASFIDIGDGPVVTGVVSDSSSSISKMVLSGPGGLDAVGSSFSVGIDLGPLVSCGLASIFLVFLGGGTIGLSAFISGLDVLRFLLVEIAIFGGRGKDGNIDPRGWVPVGEIVSLFGALESVSVSIVVLSSEDGSSSALVEVSFGGSIGDEESKVSLSGVASLVVSQGLVLAEGVIVSSLGLDGGKIGINSFGGASVSDVVLSIVSLVGATHVLDDKVAVQSRVAATMLVGPFDSEERAFIKIHFRTLAVTSLGVVLGVEQSVGIVSIRVVFSKSIIGTAHMLHIQIAEAAGHAY